VNESQKTAAMLKSLRVSFPEAWIHKVNERIAGGVPDIDIIVNTVPIRIECKDLPLKADITKALTALQFQRLLELERAGAIVRVVRFVKGEPWQLHEIYCLSRFNGKVILTRDSFTTVLQFLKEMAGGMV